VREKEKRQQKKTVNIIKSEAKKFVAELFAAMVGMCISWKNVTKREKKLSGTGTKHKQCEALIKSVVAAILLNENLRSFDSKVNYWISRAFNLSFEFLILIKKNLVTQSCW
jgi:hemoglobin-like flavoprotein